MAQTPQTPQPPQQHIVLLESGLDQAQTKEHETYLSEQHVDSGITDQKFKIGEYQSYVFDTSKATTQLAKELERANTPSIQKKVIDILNDDPKVQSVEVDGEVSHC